jgi:hypothetical protein
VIFVHPLGGELIARPLRMSVICVIHLDTPFLISTPSL